LMQYQFLDIPEDRRRGGAVLEDASQQRDHFHATVIDHSM